MRILHHVPQEFVDSWNHWLCMSEVAGVHDFTIKFRFCRIVVSYSADYIASRGRGAVITARCYASAVLAMGLCPSVCVCLCLSVCLSVTSRCSTKTAKRRITQTTPHDTPGTLVFWCQRFPRNSTGVTPTRAPNAGAVVKIGDFRQIIGHISKR